MNIIALKRILTIPVLCGLSACLPDKSELVGNWRAVAFYENGKRVETPLEPVSLYLSSTGAYRFQSQGFYEEKGAYRTSAAYLFLTDTTMKPPQEHVVKILHLSPDTLKIAMQSKFKKEQVLFLARNR
ncbi:MAG: hypothetical protein IPM81_04690 [Saprospirales bacterium]|nr:hypothetical protein [Saprospirales bacterium]